MFAPEMHKMKEIGLQGGVPRPHPHVRQCQIKSHAFTLFLSDELMRTAMQSFDTLNDP